MVKGKGKGKGKGKRKKKAPKFDTTADGTSPFGVLSGHLLRTPLGQEVMVVGVKYGNTALKLDPILWAEDSSGLQAPLALLPNIPPREQGYRLLTEFGHLACDVSGLQISPVPRTKRTADRAVTLPTFHQTYHGKMGSSKNAASLVLDVTCDICGEDIPRASFERHSIVCAKQYAAAEKLKEAKPVVGVKIEGEEGHPRVEVVKVYPGGAFEAAGIIGGGYVTHVNGTAVTNNDEFKLIIAQHRAGDIVEVREMSRDGASTNTKVMIGGAGLQLDEIKELVRLARGEFIDEDYT